MRRAVVGHPKDATGRSIRFLAHNKIGQVVKAVNARGGFAQTKDFGLPHIPGSHVSQRSSSFVFMLDTPVTPSSGGSYGPHTVTGLNAGLFIGGDNKIMAAQGLSFPDAVIQIENSCGLLLEIRIPWPNPASITPRANRILAQPAPDSFSTDGGYDSLLFHLSGDFIVRKSRKRQPELFGQLTGKCFDSNNDLRGKKRRVCPAVAFPGARPGVGQKSAFAIWTQSVVADQAADRFPCLKSLQRQGGRSWLA